MTTLAALHDPKIGTIIGCDRLYTTSIKMIGDPKWVSLTPNFWVGLCGYGKTITIVREHKEDLKNSIGSVFTFVNTLISLLNDYGYEGDRSDTDAPAYELGLLIATNKEVWSVDGMGSPAKIAPLFLIGQGSGGMAAMGAGHALGKAHDSRDRVLKAIKAGIDFDTYSGGTPWLHIIPKVAK